MDNQLIANRLRRFGESRWPSVKDMAHALGMTANSLNTGYLSGRSVPGPVVLERMFRHGCSADWLLFGVGLPPAPSVEELDVWIAHHEQLLEAYRSYRTAVSEAEKQFGPAIRIVAWFTFVDRWRGTLEAYWKKMDAVSDTSNQEKTK